MNTLATPRFDLQWPAFAGSPHRAEIWCEAGPARVRVTGLSAQQVETVTAHFGEFIINDGESPLLIELETIDPSCVRPFAPGMWEYRVHTERVSPEIVRASGIGFVAEVDVAAQRAKLGVTGGQELLGQAIENTARLLMAARLVRTQGLLFHSAAIVDRGRARLFVGRSGAGKTTLSTMMRERGLIVTSDELNAVTWDAQGAQLFGTPFAGDFGPTSPAALGPHPLVGIYLLEQAATHRVRPASGARAFGSLLAAAPFANADPLLVPDLETKLEALIAQVPVHVLEFKKDPAVWEVVSA